MSTTRLGPYYRLLLQSCISSSYKMVGANYMGGKRNAARARTKDIAGRIQKRHFGKQRLASALCRTSNDRVRKPKLPSVLPDMSLAHARRRSHPAEIAACKEAPPSCPIPEKQPHNPSKVLQALDISDHTSMRAAINRILERPDFVGLKYQVSQRSLDQICREFHQKDRIVASGSCGFDDDLESSYNRTRKQGYQLQTRTAKELPPSSFTSSSEQRCPETQTITTQHPASACSSQLFTDINNEEDSPDLTWNTLFDDSGYAESQDLTRAGDHPRLPEGDLALTAQRLRNRTLSPLPWDCQTTDHIILDLDTSPPAPSMPSETWDNSRTRLQSLDSRLGAEHSDSSSGQDFLLASGRPTQGFSFCPTRCGLSLCESDKLERESLHSPSPEASHYGHAETTYQEDPTVRCVSSEGTPDADLPHCSASFPHMNATEASDISQDSVPDGLPLDLLADPDPWATIGKILNLPTVDSQPNVTEVQVSFTREREGVGYVGHIQSDRCGSCGDGLRCMADSLPVTKYDGDLSSTDATNREAETQNPKDRDICATDKEIPMLPEDLKKSRLSPVQRPSVRPDDCSCMDVENPHTNVDEWRASTPKTSAREDVDMTSDGPCLFADSDFSEDE
ncbi:hypothetical protein F5I97DRAFT_1929350 [Phlebopus sp. FC_14]|nr:hypothetical protein F5I97DRAFT_1929350 [Phlebopus sp. FC_14]